MCVSVCDARESLSLLLFVILLNIVRTLTKRTLVTFRVIMRSVQLVFLVSKFKHYSSHACLQEPAAACLVENHFVSDCHVCDLYYVACLDFEIIKVYSNFMVTHRQKLSPVPSAHVGEGKNNKEPFCLIKSNFILCNDIITVMVLPKFGPRIILQDNFGPRTIFVLQKMVLPCIFWSHPRTD